MWWWYRLNFIALPKNDDCASLEICDNCDDKDATRCRGDGIYRSAICDTCYFRYIVGKPFDWRKTNRDASHMW